MGVSKGDDGLGGRGTGGAGAVPAMADVDGVWSSATSSGAASTQRPNGCLYAACTDQGEVPDMAVSNSSTDSQMLESAAPKTSTQRPSGCLFAALAHKGDRLQ